MSWFSGLFGDQRGTNTNSTQTGSTTGSFGGTEQIQNYLQSLAGLYNPANYGIPNPYQASAAQSQAGLNAQLGQAGSIAANIGANGLDPARISQFQSPYQQQVIDATQADFNRSNAVGRSQDMAFAVKAGVPLMNTTQSGVARSMGDYTREKAQAPVIAGLRNQGFNTAADLAKTSTGLQLQGLGQAAGVAGQQAGINQGLFGMGTGLQMQPYQIANMGTQGMAGLAPYTGTSGTSTGTMSGTQTQTATPSPFSVGANLFGTAMSLFSDERVKENIKPIGETFDGQPIYKFNYVGDPRTTVGLMAQDVEQTNPDAVGSVNGIKTVDYDKATAGAERGMSDGGSIPLSPYQQPQQKDPHEKLKKAFDAIRGLQMKAHGGPVLKPYEAGGPVGNWETTVTPASSGPDWKAMGQGIKKLGQDSASGGDKFGDTSALSSAQSSLSNMLAQLQSQTSQRQGFDAGGVVPWGENGPSFPERGPSQPMFVGAGSRPASSGPWTASDETWQGLGPTQRAAAMALLEADGRDPTAARHALSAMINRASKAGEDLGAHVSKPIYQPAIEPTQRARLGSILSSPAYKDLTQFADDRLAGRVDDPVGGATHFLAHEPVMEKLRDSNPSKYRSWVNWTGYNKGGGSYSNPDGSPVFRDKSHAFLAPEGRYVPKVAAQPPDGMDAATYAPARTPQPPDGMDAATYAPSLAPSGEVIPTASVDRVLAPYSGVTRSAEDGGKSSGWFSNLLKGGVWEGKEMTPMQRAGVALMAVKSPTMNAPMNGVAETLMGMDAARREQARIDQEAGRLFGQINGMPTIEGQKLPSEIKLREAQARKAEMDADRDYQLELEKKKMEYAKQLALATDEQKALMLPKIVEQLESGNGVRTQGNQSFPANGRRVWKLAPTPEVQPMPQQSAPPPEPPKPVLPPAPTGTPRQGSRAGPDTPATLSAARREEARARMDAARKAQDNENQRSSNAVQKQFDAEINSTADPIEMVRKFDRVRSQLTPAQVMKLDAYIDRLTRG